MREFLLASAVVAALAPMSLQATEKNAVPSASRAYIPRWLPIADFVAADGSVHWDALEAIAAHRLRYQINQVTAATEKLGPGRTAEECALLIVPGSPFSTRPTNTLADLIDHSPTIVLGRVTKLAPGLYNGILGTLVEIEAKRSYKVSGPNTPLSLRLFVEEAQVTLDGAKICKAGLDRMPTLGARLLLFYFREITDKIRDTVLASFDDDIVFELEDGTASISARMSETSGGEALPDFRRILRRVEERTAQME